MQRVLVVEDDRGIRKVLDTYLTHAGYALRFEEEGDRALAALHAWKPALVLLDVMLPGDDGWTILRRIRERSACPVIMLTALDGAQQRIDGFEQGADDYIGKPFNGNEVVARVRAVLRRTPAIFAVESTTLGSLKVDFGGRSVSLHGEPVALAPRELAVLLFLARHPNQSFTRDQLIRRVWGHDYEGSDRAVDLSIRRIRQALASWPIAEGEIQAVRGVGYKLYCAG